MCVTIPALFQVYLCRDACHDAMTTVTLGMWLSLGRFRGALNCTKQAWSRAPAQHFVPVELPLSHLFIYLFVIHPLSWGKAWSGSLWIATSLCFRTDLNPWLQDPFFKWDRMDIMRAGVRTPLRPVLKTVWCTSNMGLICRIKYRYPNGQIWEES